MSIISEAQEILKKKKKKDEEEIAPTRTTRKTGSSGGGSIIDDALQIVSQNPVQEDIAPVFDFGKNQSRMMIASQPDYFNTRQFEYDKATEERVSKAILDRTKVTALSNDDQKSLSTYIPMLANKQYGTNNWSVLKEVQIVSSMEEGEAKEKRKKDLLKELKSVISDHNWNTLTQPLDDGWDQGDIASIIMEGADRLFTVDEFNENDLYSLLTGEARDADFWDLTLNSAVRGYTNSRYGEESFAAMNGEANEKQYYENKLEGRELQFATDNWFENAISGASELLGQQARQWTNPDSLALGASAAGMAALAGQAGPQLAAPEEIVTVPGAFLTGIHAGSVKQNLEIEAGLAYNEMLEAGVSEDTAKKIAWAVGSGNAALEAVQLDELAKAYKATKATGATKTFWKKVLGELFERGVSIAKETAQEVAQEGVTIAGVQAGSKIDTGEWAYSADEVGSRLGETALSSALSFGVMNAPAGARNIASITADHKAQNTLTANEQAVVDKVFQDRLEKAAKVEPKKSDKPKLYESVEAYEAAQQETTRKLTAKEKTTIYNEVINDLEKGYISTDEIESVLGGEKYEAYKKLTDEEASLAEQQKALHDELQGLGKKTNPTLEEQSRYHELKVELTDLQKKIDAAKNNPERAVLKAQLDKDTYEMVKGDKLVESFFEDVRSKRKYQNDVTKYEGKAREVIQKVIDSGLADDSNRSHEFWDFAAQLASNRDMDVELASNEQILEMAKADWEAAGGKWDSKKFDGKTMDAYVNNGKIVINAKSKRAMNVLLGHEITHTLEKSGHYKSMQKILLAYAQSKGELESRRKDRAGTHDTVFENDPKIKEMIDMEVTADLAGDYFFTDKDFIQHLLTADKNIFQKAWDEVKYLAKMATGGEQKRLLERAKRAYEKAWDDSRAQKNTAISGVNYNISRTRSMSWAEQINGALYDGNNIRRNDTLVVCNAADTSVGNEIESKPLAIPLRVLTKASNGKDISHSIKRGKLAKLDEGIKYAPITIVNPDRNAVVYVTDIKQGGLPVIAAFDMNATFDGDEVHQATSIHLQVDTQALLESLPKSATVYVRKNELDPVGATNNLRGLAAKIKFIEANVAQNVPEVKGKFSISEIVGEDGTSYGKGVHLDSTLLDNLTQDERVGMVKEYIKELGGESFTAYDSNKNAVDITIATSSAKYKNQRGKRVPVNKDLTNKYIGNEVKQEAIALIDELVVTSKYDGSKPARYPHGWLDNNGQNDWEYWTTYIEDKNNTIWEATLNVANSKNGEKILYDISPIKKVGRSIKLDTIPTNTNIAEISEKSSGKISISNKGDTPKQYGSWNVYARDIMLDKSGDAPLRTDYSEELADPLPDDLAPVQKELDTLYARIAEMEEEAQKAIENQDADTLNAIDAEYKDVMQRIGEIEQDEQDRIGSVAEMEAPPMMEAPYVEHESVDLTKKATADIVRQVRKSLGLSNNQAATAKDIIERYRTGSIVGREKLIDELQRKLGRYTEKSRDEYLVEVQALLKSTPVNVEGYIKGGIADYKKVMQSNFGKIRFSKKGASVDQVYAELSELHPGLFPADIYVPEDQLRKMIDVANMDANTETVRNVEIGAIEEAADAIISGLRDFRRNEDLILSERESEAAFQDLLKNADLYAPEEVAPMKPLTKAAHDTYTDPTVSGAKATETGGDKKATRKELHNGIVDKVKAAFKASGFDFDKVLKNAKNLSTWSTVDNTPQRVMEKALGYKEGGVLADITVNKVAQNETEGIKWLNSFTDRKNGLLARISKQYKIKPGSKKSAAAQMYAEGFYVDENNDIIAYGDAELAKDFPDVNAQRDIKGLANDPRIRRVYDETLAKINESRARNLYPEIPRLDNYFLHFRAMEDTFSTLGLPFNPNDIRAKDLPTDLNGVTADLKPGQPYFASAKHREGKRTSFDLLGGLERYLSSAKNQIFHIDDIQTLRALRNYIAETYGQATGLEDIDSMTDAEAEERIRQVYGAHLSTFAKFLNEEANVLAGKTALIDRGLEGIIGRRGITFLDTLNRQVGSNMVGYNISSSLTNFLPVAQTLAKTNKFDFVKAFAQTVANKVSRGRFDSFTEDSPVVIRRKGADRFYRTPWQKLADPGYALMGLVDDISTEIIARTKYNEFTRNKMDPQKAHFETDKWVSKLMGDRSLGQQPQLYNSKMLGLVTKFQLEVRNQLDAQFYDTIQETKVDNEHIKNGLLRNAKTAAKVASTFTQLAIAQHLFGKAFESVAGYNPAFDIIGVLLTAFGYDDEEDSEDTVLDNIEQGFLELLEDMPYASAVLDGGRIPISDALPIKEFIKGEDRYGNEKDRLETLAEVAPYYLMPGGYGQAKKTYQGLNMFSDDHPIAGSYTDSGSLRFPVENNFQSRIQAAIFGQYANENAREYFDNDYAPLKEKQIQEFVDSKLPIGDYREYRDGLKGLTKQADKLAYINSLDMTEEQKNVLKSYLFDEAGYAEENPEKYAFLENEGIGYLGYKQLDSETQESWSWAFSHQDEYRYLKENGVYPEDYSVDRIPMIEFDDEDNKAYQWAFDNPEKATFGKLFGGGVKEYRKYANDLDNINADKDKNGKTISDSRKEKVIDYINNLYVDYGTKIILFKSEYNADDTYNRDIIDYLNSRDDISYKEKVTILKYLGFEVDSDGRIT